MMNFLGVSFFEEFLILFVVFMVFVEFNILLFENYLFHKRNHQFNLTESLSVLFQFENVHWRA